MFWRVAIIFVTSYAVSVLCEDPVPVCQLDSVTGPCRAAHRRYFYNQSNGECEEFIFGGCRGNDNNFATLEECQQRCIGVPVCSLKAEVGKCKAAIPMYYHNSQTGRCENFIYGGCDGNDNRFWMKEDCERHCPQAPNDFCNEESDPGMCMAAFPRYYYNSTLDVCEFFIYGGCGGNSNNFENTRDCMESCSSTEYDICTLPPDAGPCTSYANEQKYYYNSESGRCEVFTYGGCYGNDNRFGTLNECEERCPAQESNICNLPMYEGPCDATSFSYFYNSETEACEGFIYGGCAGNANRFETLEECTQACQ